MTNQTLSCREAFEKWLRSVWTPSYGCQKDAYGNYVDHQAQIHWSCWQAAWNTRAQSSATEGGEAVAWLMLSPRGVFQEMTTISDEMRKREAEGWKITPLYTRSNAQVKP